MTNAPCDQSLRDALGEMIDYYVNQSEDLEGLACDLVIYLSPYLGKDSKVELSATITDDVRSMEQMDGEDDAS